MPLRAVFITLCLLLLLPRPVRAAPPESGSSLPRLETVAVSELQGPPYGLKLTFERLRPEPGLARFSQEDARAFVAAMEEAFRFTPGIITAGALFGSPTDMMARSDLERMLRAAYEDLYGPSSMPLPSSLEDSRWFQALKRSPRYMDEGVREAALEMRFSVGARTRAQVSVADGTVVLMGVSAGTTASAVSSAVAASRTTGACRDESNKGDARGHHIATDKNDTAEVRGGPWTPKFKALFDRAGMSLDDPANIVHLTGHKGPHPEAYHVEIYDRLSDATSTCQTQLECKRKLIEALDEIAGDICKPGSRLNKLLTKSS